MLHRIGAALVHTEEVPCPCYSRFHLQVTPHRHSRRRRPARKAKESSDTIAAIKQFMEHQAMLNNTIDYRARQSITKHAEIDDMIEQLGDRVAELERVEEKVLEQQLQIAQLQEQVHAVLTQGTISTNTNTGKAGGKPTKFKAAPGVTEAVQNAAKALIGISASRDENSRMQTTLPKPHTEIPKRMSGGHELFSPNWLVNHNDAYNLRFLEAVVQHVLNATAVSLLSSTLNKLTYT